MSGKPRILLRARYYAMSGTAIAPVLAIHCYERATRCPVLTWRMRVPGPDMGAAPALSMSDFASRPVVGDFASRPGLLYAGHGLSVER
eukprot:3372777-Rhodomonas_salina.3